MTTKYTPGPWKIKWYDGYSTIGSADGHGWLARVLLRKTKTNNVDEKDANTRLIAEAPAMAEALRPLADDRIITASDREALAREARAILARIDGNPKEA